MRPPDLTLARYKTGYDWLKIKKEHIFIPDRKRWGDQLEAFCMWHIGNTKLLIYLEKFL